MQADIGLIGLAVMGQNLVLNMNDHGYTVAVYNRTPAVTDAFLAGNAKDTKVIAAHSLEELAGLLKRPRRVMLMVKAGRPVDEIIETLIPLLEPGDIIIDGGNSNYEDTMRRTAYVESKGLALHRHRRLGRRGRRAAWPIHHAGRFARSLAARQADLPGHRGQSRRPAVAHGRSALL